MQDACALRPDARAFERRLRNEPREFAGASPLDFPDGFAGHFERKLKLRGWLGCAGSKDGRTRSRGFLRSVELLFLEPLGASGQSAQDFLSGRTSDGQAKKGGDEDSPFVDHERSVAVVQHRLDRERD